MVETLMYKDKYDLLNYLYSIKNINKNSLEMYLKEYFERNKYATNNEQYIIMYNLNKPVILILDKGNKWAIAEPEDQREFFSNEIVKEKLKFDKNSYNKYVGFIGYKKNNSMLVFKTKDMDSKRDTGATCEESGKEKSIQKLNLILGEEKYTKENTKMQRNKEGEIINEGIGQIELCVLQEFILRYYNVLMKNGKLWFLSPEMAIGHNLYKIFT